MIFVYIPGTPLPHFLLNTAVFGCRYETISLSYIKWYSPNLYLIVDTPPSTSGHKVRLDGLILNSNVKYVYLTLSVGVRMVSYVNVVVSHLVLDSSFSSSHHHTLKNSTHFICFFHRSIVVKLVGFTVQLKLKKMICVVWSVRLESGPRGYQSVLGSWILCR